MAKLTKARITKMAKDPGSRSKIPTAQLPAKYRKLRAANTVKAKRNAALDDPAALTMPLTPRLLGQQVDASANLAYGDAEQSLAGQQAQSQSIQASIPSWFQDYQSALQRATDQTKATYAAAAAGQQNAVNSSSALDAQHQAGMQQQMQQGAAVSGTQVDPAVAQMAQQASASRRAAGDAQTGLTLGLGAANVGYRSGQQVVGAQQQVKSHLDEAQRSRNIGGKASALAKEKGAYKATTRQKMVDAEHTKGLERKAFGLNVEKTRIDAELSGAALDQKRRDAERRSTDAAATRASRESIAAADRATREREGKLTRLTRKKTAQTIATSGVTPTEKRRRNTSVAKAEASRDKAVNAAKTYTKNGKRVIKPETLRTLLTEDFPSAPKEAIDYAMAAALGSRAGVTKKGQPDAAKRYRAYLKKLADGSLAG